MKPPKRPIDADKLIAALECKAAWWQRELEKSADKDDGVYSIAMDHAIAIVERLAKAKK